MDTPGAPREAAEVMDPTELADFVTLIDGPTFCGQLLAGEPHGVWLYFEEGGVRVVVYELGEIVDASGPGLALRGRRLE